MVDIQKLIFEIIREVIIGVIFLIIALFVVPEGIIAWFIKKLKPGIFDKIHDNWEQLVQYMTNIFIAHNMIEFESNVLIRKQFDRIKIIEQYVSKIEKNLYFVDLSVDLLRTLEFSCTGTFGSIDNKLISQSMNYLQYYTQKIEYDEQDPSFFSNICNTLDNCPRPR